MSSSEACSKATTTAILSALRHENVLVVIEGTDHYMKNMVSVETDYILSVSSGKKKSTCFESFKISKTFKQFRSLTKSLVQATEAQGMNCNANSSEICKLVEYAHSISKLLDSSSRTYLAKVNYEYVKKLAQQRTLILKDALNTLMNSFVPLLSSIQSSSISDIVLTVLEHFFLTDHLAEDSSSTKEGEEDTIGSEPSNLKRKSSNPVEMIQRGVSSIMNNTKMMKVMPMSKKTRHLSINPSTVGHLSVAGERDEDDEDDDDDDNNNATKKGGDRKNAAFQDGVATSSSSTGIAATAVAATAASLNPWNDVLQDFLASTSSVIVSGIVLALLVLLKVASTIPIPSGIPLDYAVLGAFGMYCLGLHTLVPTPTMKKNNNKSAKKMTTRVHRQSLLVPVRTTPEDGNRSAAGIVDDYNDDTGLLKSPFQMFPDNAALGDHLNCWSMPDSTNFKVRGPKYLDGDKKKIPSTDFLFPARGMDLMLTDAAPENVGQNSAILGGALREKPTFVINFRLPWGVVILYFEIPEKYIPFVKSRYEYGYDEDKAEMSKVLKSMSPAERCMAKFLQADEATKNKVLKIVPVVVKGPWICKSVVGGKPAIIGKALPVTYVYEKESGPSEALYLEADMDVVSSAAARHILSVVRGYTQVLTLDLGFVVQGNESDELPEQMLGAVRCHGIDIYSASPLPPMKSQFEFAALPHNGSNSDDES